MAKLKTGTKDSNGELITLDKSEAALIYAQVNRSRLQLLRRIDNLDLVGSTDASRPSDADPPEVQLLLQLNQSRKNAADGNEEATISKVMLGCLKDLRAEANRASGELQHLLLAQQKKSDIPTMADVMKRANES